VALFQSQPAGLDMKDQQALGSVYPFIAASVVTENAPIKARGEQFSHSK
tara:strand:- start:540 stop:686 length:147 start_codon:yes stop_codon:yes gene_type:complete